jgi:hypothetical protein
VVLAERPQEDTSSSDCFSDLVGIEPPISTVPDRVIAANRSYLRRKSKPFRSLHQVSLFALSVLRDL